MTNCVSELNNDVAYPTRLNGRASQSKVSAKVSEYL